MNPIIALLKKQPTRILSYIIAGFLLGNWVGVNYSAQSVAFWAQPIVALIMTVWTVVETLKKNKETEIEKVAAKFMDPPAVATPQEQAILSKLVEQHRMEKQK